eukprot:212546_1
MGGIIGGAIGIIGLIALSIYLLRKTFDRIDRSTQDSENIVLQRRRLQRHTVPYDRNIIRQQIESAISAARTPEEEKERKEREAYIIDKLIHKTVVTRKLTDSDYEDISIVVPHDILASLSVSQHQDDIEGSIRSNSKKLDILLKKCRSIKPITLSNHSLHSSSFIDGTSEHSLYSPQNCSICCEDYKVGEQIAWSQNNACPHAYHVDCILKWLISNNDCPMCRAEYLTPELDSTSNHM